MGFETMPFENKGGAKEEGAKQRKWAEKMNNLIDQIEEINNDLEKQKLDQEEAERERSVLKKYSDHNDGKKLIKQSLLMAQIFKNNPEAVRRILKRTPDYKA